MAVVTDWAVIETASGPMRMYMARPQGGTAGPGVLVVQDAYGLTDDLQAVCRHFAEEGLIALAPELYHRLTERTAPYDDETGATALRAQLTDDQVIDDLTLALRYLGGRGEVRSGLTGAVGYGSGGRDAFLLATRNPDVLALVSYHGAISAGPAAALPGSGKLSAPALLFYGEGDRVAAEAGDVDAELTRLNKDHEVVTVPGAAAGFFCEPHPAYDADAAADTWNRTVDFIYQWLEG